MNEHTLKTEKHICAYIHTYKYTYINSWCNWWLIVSGIWQPHQETDDTLEPWCVFFLGSWTPLFSFSPTHPRLSYSRQSTLSCLLHPFSKEATQASSSVSGWFPGMALCPIYALCHTQLLFTPPSACGVAIGCCSSASQMWPLGCILFAMIPISLHLVMLGDAF